MLHFRRLVFPWTDASMGNCSYLDTCRHMKTCRFVRPGWVRVWVTLGIAQTWATAPTWTPAAT